MGGGLPLRPSQGANTVQPIRNLEKIRQIKELLIHRSYRDYFLFFMGINSGLRVSDILPLRVWDVKSATHLKVREKKTGKTRRILMTDALKSEIQKYCRTLGDSDYLFPSRNGDKPISRVQAWNIINAAAREAGIQESIGTHSMRKTFGYHFYQKYKDLVVLQQIFGHSSQSVTMRYIGITDDMIDQAMQNFSL